MKIIFTISFLLLLVPPTFADVGQIDEYLILKSIGQFRFNPKNQSMTSGDSGVLGKTGHFYHDHKDFTYRATYDSQIPVGRVSVEVTYHTGGESDEWLSHELEHGLRSSAGNALEIVQPVRVGNYTVFLINQSEKHEVGYRWVSGSKTVDVVFSYVLNKTQEPDQKTDKTRKGWERFFIEEYLWRHPSNLPNSIENSFTSEAGVKDWSETEMDRLLFLCGKWLRLYDSKTAEKDTVAVIVTDFLNSYLDLKKQLHGLSVINLKLDLFKWRRDGDIEAIKQAYEAELLESAKAALDKDSEPTEQVN